MESKTKTIIGIILLTVGGGLVPTGFFMNNFFRISVADGVPDALLGIKEEALPELESQIPPLSTPDVLLGIKDEAILTLQQQIPVLATPDILLNLKAYIEGNIEVIINCTTSANIMNLSIYATIPAYGMSFLASLDGFMNDLAYPAPLVFGVSQVAGTSLSYTAAAQQAFMINGISDPLIGDIPGLINDTSMGTGVCGFLQVFEATYDPIIGDAINTTIRTLYNATWIQLEALAGYLIYYLFLQVPTVFQLKYQMPVQQAVNWGFYYQWANGTLIPDGIDLSAFLTTYDQELKGLEAGVPDPTGIANLTTITMWNPSHPLSFVNDTGIFAWLDTSYQATIESAFVINSTQYLMVLSWLNNFITNVAPVILYERFTKSVPELALEGFYEQWANGTIQGEKILADGFLSQMDPPIPGPPYFEVGLPTATNITLATAIDLWDNASEYTFVNGDGILIWVGAVTNATLELLLLNTFDVSRDQLTTLINWLDDFVSSLTVPIIEAETGKTLSELALAAFYEQWAYGTINGEVIIPDGFLSLRDPPIYGPPYFEIGFEYDVGLTDPQILALWNEESNASLVTVRGVNKWYAADQSSTIWDDLKNINQGLTDEQVTSIKSWLSEFRNKIVNKLAKDELDLPLEPYTLGSILLLGLGAGGGVLAILGIIALIRSKRI